MKKLALFISTLIISISTYAYDPIEYVKGSIYPFDKSRTYAQVLDYRKACKSTIWWTEVLVDGRDVVWYKCVFNGIEAEREADTPDRANGYGELLELGEIAGYIIGANGKVYHAESWQYVERERLIIKIPYYHNNRTVRIVGEARTKTKPTNIQEYDWHVQRTWNMRDREFYDKEGNRIHIE